MGTGSKAHKKEISVKIRQILFVFGNSEDPANCLRLLRPYAKFAG